MARHPQLVATIGLRICVEAVGRIPGMALGFLLKQALRDFPLFPRAQVGRALALNLQVALGQEELHLRFPGQMFLEQLTPTLSGRLTWQQFRQSHQQPTFTIPQLGTLVLDEQGVERSAEAKGIHGALKFQFSKEVPDNRFGRFKKGLNPVPARSSGLNDFYHVGVCLQNANHYGNDRDPTPKRGESRSGS